MYFQVLDDKKECIGVYYDGQIDYEANLNHATRTWKYSPYLRDLEVEYAQIYCQGRSLDDVCPPHLKEEYESISHKLKAFLTSFQEAKVLLTDNCFFDLVPSRFLLEFCDIKNQITKHVFENFFRPKNYRFLASAQEMLYDIGSQELNIDESALTSKLADVKARSFLRKIKSTRQSIDYDLFGTKTGRLSTRKGSFPLMTLNKDYRSILKPNNDLFVEFDYNAAELRTLLALSGKSQPDQDIHQWNADNVYGGTTTRDQAKKRIFAWLYNPKSKDRLSEKFYDRNKILTRYWVDGIITTEFDRQIKVEREKALNYLIQSTTSDMFMTQCIEMSEKLRDHKTNIAFLLHDSIVLDVSAEERGLVSELSEMFSNTKLGRFKTNISIGRDYGTMRGIA